MDKLDNFSFYVANTTDVSGTKYAGFAQALGETPTCYSDAKRILKEKKAVPAEEFRYTKVEPKRAEITEKELGDVMVEKLGEIS